MGLELLRQLVRSLIVEDEEKLKRWAEAEGTPIEKELAKLGIVPIHHGEEQTSKLGSGMYNIAIDVLYKGRRAVARVSKNPEELSSLLEFVGFKEVMDPKYSKHFPKVFKTFEFEADDIRIVGNDRGRRDDYGDPIGLSDEPIKYYGAVVELLDPIPPGLEFDMDTIGLDDTLQSSRVSGLLDGDAIDDLIQQATSRPDDAEAIRKVFALEIKPKLRSFIGKPLVDLDEFIDGAIEGHNSVAFRRFGAGLIRLVRGSVIPQNAGHSSVEKIRAKNHPSSKVKEFMEFLEALEAEGMSWDDLHTGNFMVRRSTGDFVVVDPGFFEKT